MLFTEAIQKYISECVVELYCTHNGDPSNLIGIPCSFHWIHSILFKNNSIPLSVFHSIDLSWNCKSIAEVSKSTYYSTNWWYFNSFHQVPELHQCTHIIHVKTRMKSSSCCNASALWWKNRFFSHPRNSIRCFQVSTKLLQNTSTPQIITKSNVA